MKAKKTDHIILRAPNMLVCLHCGDSYAYALPAPCDIVVATSKSFEKLHKGCQLSELGLACAYCQHFGHTPDACPTTQYGGKPEAWRAGPDTGLSSITIWEVMMGRAPTYPAEPLDPSDFGRCHRLLQAFPTWRARIGEMAAVRGWEKLAPAWDELEQLYLADLAENTGRAPKLYARMRELTR